MPVRLRTTSAAQRRKQTHLVRVDGEAHTYATIAARMGVDHDKARARVHTLRRSKRPVTWASLGVKGAALAARTPAKSED